MPIWATLRPCRANRTGKIPHASPSLRLLTSLPISQLEERLAELPAGSEVVAYCRGPYCVFAHEAVRLLRARGRPARRLIGGMPEWRLAGMPVAADEVSQPART